MTHSEYVPWLLPANAPDLHVARNVGGIFKVYNLGPGDIRLAGSANPADQIKAGRTILVNIDVGSDLVIGLAAAATQAAGTVELITSL